MSVYCFPEGEFLDLGGSRDTELRPDLSQGVLLPRGIKKFHSAVVGSMRIVGLPFSWCHLQCLPSVLKVFIVEFFHSFG